MSTSRFFRYWPVPLCCLLGLLILSRHQLRARLKTWQEAKFRDVVYGEAGGQQLHLDIYGAESGMADPLSPKPALILLHGGGWVMGSKNDMAALAGFFSQRGYVCFAVEYRLAQGNTNHYPAAVDDVQRAVRWVRAHANDYGVDKKRLGAVGESAGGHLAVLLGTMETRDNLDTTLASYSSRVQCVVDCYGPVDFTVMLPTHKPEAFATHVFVEKWLGKKPTGAVGLYREASPITHIDKHSAPCLILHGGRDTLVPLSQSQRFDRALKAHGIESRLVVFPAEGHGFVAPKNVALARQESLAFLDRHLKRSVQTR